MTIYRRLCRQLSLLFYAVADTISTIERLLILYRGPIERRNPALDWPQVRIDATVRTMDRMMVED